MLFGKQCVKDFFSLCRKFFLAEHYIDRNDDTEYKVFHTVYDADGASDHKVGYVADELIDGRRCFFQ